jgi:GPH family glycoside/pentoside/hexuronide:cation symporter
MHVILRVILLGRLHYDNSTVCLNEMHNIVLSVKQNGKPVIVTETDDNQGNKNQNATPSKANAMKYFANVDN